MANIRNLKKDIKQMVKHFIQECYIHLVYSPPLNQENVLDIISDALMLEIEVLDKINNQKDIGDMKLKHYYRKVSSDFYNSIIELTERLNSLTY
ncbi:MAG TPA: hypothetical protein DG754_11025 [Bacteroidales bacterium]|jgi:hypothetical protein|nr:hypothetical protein [Bacteroidales bacterium]